MNKTKVAYKPVGILLGMAAGPRGHGLPAAVAALRRRSASSTDEDRGEIIAAAALQRFAVVKAAADRSGAQVVRLTGTWPD